MGGGITGGYASHCCFLLVDERCLGEFLTRLRCREDMQSRGTFGVDEDQERRVVETKDQTGIDVERPTSFFSQGRQEEGIHSRALTKIADPLVSGRGRDRRKRPSQSTIVIAEWLSQKPYEIRFLAISRGQAAHAVGLSSSSSQEPTIGQFLSLGGTTSRRFLTAG